jgi:indole-3-glycerol phosphate synthase
MSVRRRPFAAAMLLGCAFIIPTTTTSFLTPNSPSHPHIRDPRRPWRRPRYDDDGDRRGGDDGDDERTAPASSSSPSRLSSSRSSGDRGGDSGGIYGAVHRKEHEMKRLSAQHASLSDPVRMAMSYAQEGVERKRLAAALRRVYDDPENAANTNARLRTPGEVERGGRMLEAGLTESTMRRGSFVVDVKRRSGLSYPGEQFARYDDAGAVAEAMVRLGVDVVLVNVDYHSYGGDLTELRSAVRAVRAASDTAAVVMKDIVVDELQLGLAKEAGADGIVLCAAVLGPALENFLNLATVIGLETIVECHTYNEVRAALDALAQNIMVTNRDRITGELVADQAMKLAGMFPGSGGPVVTIAGGGITDTDQMKKLLAVGYDGVVVGRAVMGSARAPEFIGAVRNRTLLPAEFSQWGLDGFEFDMDGNVMSGPRTDVPSPGDADVFM